MSPLAFIPSWVTAAIIAALVLALGIEEVRIASLKTDHAEYVAGIEKQRHIQADMALKEQSRRQQAFDDEATHARNEIKELEAAVSRMSDDADGLRDELAAFNRRARANPKPAVGSKGEPGLDALDLLTVLYDRADREAAILAEHADRLRVAGLSCERAADKAR